MRIQVEGHYKALFNRYQPNREQARKVWCPECKALPGENCRLKRGVTPKRPTGHRASCHLVRYYRYVDLRAKRDRRKGLDFDLD